MRLAKLTGVLAKFADPDSPYYSLLHPMWTTHYGTYDHLARVQEWSLTGATNEDPAVRMNKPREIPAAVTERQTAASDPGSSAWVAANAGSGKTHVLAQRVIRLLLSGVDPARILCITFTKAAAANMANRVFNDLRSWTVLDDAALDEAMRKAGEKRIDAKRRQRARQLFALALETPGGLKVHTIHAFCTQLLHLFPFEANVAARFEVLDETTENQLLEQISLDVMLKAADAPDSPLGRALAQAVLAAADVTFRDLVREVIRQRDKLMRWVEAAGGVPQAMAQLSQSLGVGPDETVEQVETKIFDDSLIASSEWTAVGAALTGGSKTDKDHGARFHALAALSGTDLLDTYLDIFCTARAPRSATRSAPPRFRKRIRACASDLHAERDRVWALVQRKRAIEARDRSIALFTIAHAVIERFRAEKDRRGLLDYEDLIDKTLDLLNNVSAAWVHYKLDRGIHHVLIDEAQDTSPKQWEIVKALVSEFFAGEGAHDRKRTIFAVGDEKQSIFSFQGAAPREFAVMREHFEGLHKQAELDFVSTEFKHSFRSGENVLGAVDTVFRPPQAHAGLTRCPKLRFTRRCRRRRRASSKSGIRRRPTSARTSQPWDAPFDTERSASGVVKLAKRIAKHRRAVAAPGPARQGRADPGAAARRAVRVDHSRAEERRRPGRRRRPAGADRAHRGDGPDGAGRRVAAAAGRSGAGDRAEEPAVRARRGRTVQARLGSQGQPAERACATQRPDLSARLDALRRTDARQDAVRVLRRPARRRRRAAGNCWAGSATRRTTRSTNFSISRSTTSACETPSLQGFVAWLRSARPR